MCLTDKTHSAFAAATWANQGNIDSRFNGKKEVTENPGSGTGRIDEINIFYPYVTGSFHLEPVQVTPYQVGEWDQEAR